MTSMITKEEMEAETRAYLDAFARIARNDIDWGVYFEGDERPQYPWWRRFLRL